MRSARALRRIVGWIMLASVVALGATACASGGPTPGAPAASATGGTDDFPTGPVVSIPAGFQPSQDHVDRTGAYLPANGKPTLVYVDAIW